MFYYKTTIFRPGRFNHISPKALLVYFRLSYKEIEVPNSVMDRALKELKIASKTRLNKKHKGRCGKIDKVPISISLSL